MHIWNLMLISRSEKAKSYNVSQYPNKYSLNSSTRLLNLGNGIILAKMQRYSLTCMILNIEIEILSNRHYVTL